MRVDALSVLVPETTSDLDDFLQAREDEVRFARKIGDVQSISEAQTVNKFTHGHLR